MTVESYFWTVAAVAEHDDYVFFSFFFWTVAAVAEHDDHAHHH